jgi:hypothetical protein
LPRWEAESCESSEAGGADLVAVESLFGFWAQGGRSGLSWP